MAASALGLGWLLSSSFVLQVLDEFSKQVDRSEWPSGCPASIYYTALDDYLSTYQVGSQEALRAVWPRAL